MSEGHYTRSISDIRDFVEATKALLKTTKDTVEIGRGLMNDLKGLRVTVRPDEERTIIQEILVSTQGQATKISPKIALVGMTKAGKSSLLDALFGKEVAEVKRTSDTTDCVIRVEFPNGLVLYDTPGIQGSEEYNYENITREFLGIPQINEVPRAETIPFIRSHGSEKEYLSPEILQKVAPVTAVVWVVDASYNPLRASRTELRNFYLELRNKFDGHILICGTHLDVLNGLSEQEREKFIKTWDDISDKHMILVSTLTGDGFTNLVFSLFQVLPGGVSLTALQQSLQEKQKLGRISFVITEVSKLMANILLLTGREAEEIQASSIVLFSLIFSHYSVDPATWRESGGDIIKIAEAVEKKGIDVTLKKRDPSGFWETLESWMGKEFYNRVEKYQKIGVEGLQELLPSTYDTIYKFENGGTPILSQSAIREILVRYKPFLQESIELGNRERLSTQIGNILTYLFDAKPI